MTQTPASVPLELLTTPPMSALPMRTVWLLSWPGRNTASATARSTARIITDPECKPLLLISEPPIRTLVIILQSDTSQRSLRSRRIACQTTPDRCRRLVHPELTTLLWQFLDCATVFGD